MYKARTFVHFYLPPTSVACFLRVKALCHSYLLISFWVPACTLSSARTLIFSVADNGSVVHSFIGQEKIHLSYCSRCISPIITLKTSLNPFLFLGFLPLELEPLWIYSMRTVYLISWDFSHLHFSIGLILTDLYQRFFKFSGDLIRLFLFSHAIMDFFFFLR